MLLNLTRPLAFFDLEATGPNPVTDRITQIAVNILLPDLTWGQRLNFYLNPEKPQSPEAAAKTGLTDDFLARQFKFAERAQEIRAFLEGCDLAGFNILKFDVPLLCEEFGRLKINWPAEGTRFVDSYVIFRRSFSHSLAHAFKHYTGQEIDPESAHEAGYDNSVTAEVFFAQLARHGEELGADLDSLNAFCLGPRAADFAGCLSYNDAGEMIYNFGKHKGQPVMKHPAYAEWVYKEPFSRDTKMKLHAYIKEQSRPAAEPLTV